MRALTSFLSFFINPLTTFFLARGRRPLESLAVLLLTRPRQAV